VQGGDEMRGTVSKRIRRAVYGDMSLKTPRRYIACPYGMNVGLRREYLATKREYRNLGVTA